MSLLGIRSATFDLDASGTPVGSSYLYPTPRDMGRVGQLMLNDGCWEQERLLPEGWVERVTRPSTATLSGQSRDLGQGEHQGQQFWLNAPNPGCDKGPRFPDIPESACAAMGLWRQRIWVLPDPDIVAVRTGDDRDGRYSDNDWIPLALALAESLPKPPPPELELILEEELGAETEGDLTSPVEENP